MALTCRIELNKQHGITLTVEDAQQQRTQTVVLDGASIVLTCKDQEGTSTITQKSDAVTVKCKSFTVDAETITLTSQKDSTIDCGQKLSVKTKSDLALDSQAGIDAKAAKDVTLSGENVSGKGKIKASLAAATVACTGDQKVELAAPTVSAGADLKLDLKGTIVKVAADGTLEVGGQMSKLTGQMINVSGPLINLGSG